MSVKYVLVVDDDTFTGGVARAIAVKANYECRVVPSCNDMMSAIAVRAPDLIVLDIVMPDEDGIEALRRLRDRRSRAAIVLMSAYEPRYLDAAKALGEAYGLRIVATMTKPLSPDRFIDILKNSDAT